MSEKWEFVRFMHELQTIHPSSRRRLRLCPLPTSACQV
jgi:hypothetical protein